MFACSMGFGYGGANGVVTKVPSLSRDRKCAFMVCLRLKAVLLYVSVYNCHVIALMVNDHDGYGKDYAILTVFVQSFAEQCIADMRMLTDKVTTCPICMTVCVCNVCI